MLNIRGDGTASRRDRSIARSRIAAAFAGVVVACALAATPAAAQHGRGGGGFRGGFRGGDFHGRDFGGFRPDELRFWRGGAWRHEWHDGRLGWWWLVGGGWYFYPEPIWPYPTYVPPALAVEPAPPLPTGLPPTQYWYYCDNPQGYYPYVATCGTPWRQVPVTTTR